VLIFALSLPFYLAGALTTLQVIPGVPVSGFAVVCPVTAAVILVYIEGKSAGVILLLKRSFDYQRIKVKIWWVPMIFLAPGIALLQYGVIRLMGTPLPALQSPGAASLALAVALFIGALGEELGWSGYVIDPMQDRLGALQASIALGLVWAVWHIVPLAQLGRSPGWIAWWCLGTVALRVLIVWLYNNTGKSVFAATVLHAMFNLAWQLFPINGSFFDPRINGLLMAVFAVAVALIWGPHTLARYRNTLPATI
jgi:uncharacterized protein